MTNIAVITGQNIKLKNLTLNCGLYYGLWITAPGEIASFKSGLSLDYNLLASSPYGTIVNFQIVSGFLPIGLSMNPADGHITGTTVESGGIQNYNFSVEVRDSLDKTQIRAFSIELTGTTVVWITPEGELGPVGIGGPINIQLEADVE